MWDMLLYPKHMAQLRDADLQEKWMHPTALPKHCHMLLVMSLTKKICRKQTVSNNCERLP